MLLKANNTNTPKLWKCVKCRNSIALTSFPWLHQKKGYTSTCSKCMASKKDWRQKQKLAKGSNKENIDPQGSAAVDPEAETQDDMLSLLSLEEFLTILGQQDDSMTLDANVDIKGLTGEMRECADTLAGLVWESMNYWFL
jgi:hypothetical protein